jgi:hypothetical protein
MHAARCILFLLHVAFRGCRTTIDVHRTQMGGAAAHSARLRHFELATNSSR